MQRLSGSGETGHEARETVDDPIKGPGLKRCSLYLWAASFVSILLMASHCTRKGKPDLPDRPLVFWHSFVAATHPALEETLSRFEAECPGIRIKAQYVPTGDGLLQKLAAALQSGTGPDICWIHADFINRLASSGALLPLNGFIEGGEGLSASDLDDFFRPLLESVTRRDTLWALPMEATTLALLYHRDLFREADLDPDRPPVDWAELKEFALRLTRDTNGDGKTDRYGFYVPVFPASGDLGVWMVLQWTPFLWQAGGSLVSADGSKAAFNGTAGVCAASLWRDLYRSQNLQSYSLSHDVGFASKTMAMVLDGPWDLPRYEKMKDPDWAVAPLPAGPAGPATYLGGESLALLRNSGRPSDAWKFLRWMVRPDNQAFFCMKSGYLPVRRSVLSLADYRNFLGSHPHHRAFAARMESGRSRDVMDHQAEINRLIADAIERIIIGGRDPATTLDEAAEKADGILARRADTGRSQDE
ncbi:ABC transporter substrate-binding protein [bacterium]|nr:ABC transporter substrate-binding protein [bacterium]